MSQLYKWQFRDFFQNDRKKLIQLLISEIIFLNYCLDKANKKKEKNIIKKSCKEFEKLLVIQQGQLDVTILEEDYKKLILIIIQAFNKIVNKLS